MLSQETLDAYRRMTPGERLALGFADAIMGGIAVRAHGIPRPTYDVDFTLALARRG